MAYDRSNLNWTNRVKIIQTYLLICNVSGVITNLACSFLPRLSSTFETLKTSIPKTGIRDCNTRCNLIIGIAFLLTTKWIINRSVSTILSFNLSILDVTQWCHAFPPRLSYIRLFNLCDTEIYKLLSNYHPQGRADKRFRSLLELIVGGSAIKSLVLTSGIEWRKEKANARTQIRVCASVFKVDAAAR